MVSTSHLVLCVDDEVDGDAGPANLPDEHACEEKESDDREHQHLPEGPFELAKLQTLSSFSPDQGTSQ